MPPKSPYDRRALMIQLARLGDLVQSLPAIEAVRERDADRQLDLLCSSPLTPVLSRSHALRRVIPWDGTQWRAWANQWVNDPAATFRAVQTYLNSLGATGYDRVYNLNQHTRGMVLSHLFSSHHREGHQEMDPDQDPSPWVQYLRRVATERGDNRVHLADAWCGVCGVTPRGLAPQLDGQEVDLPEDLATIGDRKGLWIALVAGAGDSARCVSPAVWSSWIREFLTQSNDGQVVLVGSGVERETAQAIFEATPTLLQGRVWDATGRTTLTQLMALLSRCQWVVGADTGPLHLATAVRSRALGFYFARARVHETGPYGEGHWVYQHATQTPPANWPITESVELICAGGHRSAPEWALWRSHLDRWGVFFDDGSVPQTLAHHRAAVWQSLSPKLYESVAA